MATLTMPRHVLGIDLGTTNLRVQVAHYDHAGRPTAEPSLVRLPGSERDGALPTVLEFDDSHTVQAYGRPALLNMPRGNAERFAYEFKPCIGQAAEDMSAQGRPDKAKYCSNPNCLHPGWAWSIAMRFCGFCASPLRDGLPEEGWKP